MGEEPLIQSLREIGVIHPGETLLLASDEVLSIQQALDIKHQVEKLMPDVTVVVVSGLKVTVQRDA